MRRAPLSMCLITAGESTLEAAVESVRPHVNEVCITYTKPWDERGEEVRQLADQFSICTECLDENGDMADFSVARRASFALATEQWIGWLDSDDAIDGAEHLDEVLGCAHGHERPRLLGEYLYAFDPLTGACTTSQWRERIIRRGSPYAWKYPVHETLVATDGRNEDYRIEQPVRWVHKRNGEVGERNIRILMANPDESSAWWHLQMGKELTRLQRPDEAIPHLEKYIGLSKWDDERAWAMLMLSDACYASAWMASDSRLQKDDRALWWARQARELRPNTFGPLFQLAKLLTLQASLLGDETGMRDATEYARMALATPEKFSPHASNPYERGFAVHNLIRANAETLGDWESALHASEQALKYEPNNGPILLARKRYASLAKAERVTVEHVEMCVYRATMPCGDDGLDVLFLCGESVEPWNPQIAERKGIGGSETAVMEVSKRLAARGHRVKVYNDCVSPGEYDGVEYTFDLRDVTEAEVLVAWRDATFLEHIPARTKIVWAHDLGIHNANRWNLHLADRVVGVSNWHVEELLRTHEKSGLTRDKCVAIGNGIDPARFPPPPSPIGNGLVLLGELAHPTPRRNPHRVIYSSSHERGLLQLLRIWPSIRSRVPDATLHVFYGAEVLKRVDSNLAKQIDEAMDGAGDGIIDHGRVNQAELAREMLKSGVWVHPSWLPDGRPWRETSCISSMEALAAGLRVVCTPHAALAETVFAGIFVAGDQPDVTWENAFEGAVVRALTRVEETGEREAHAREARRRFSWDVVADAWERMLRELTRESEAA